VLNAFTCGYYLSDLGGDQLPGIKKPPSPLINSEMFSKLLMSISVPPLQEETYVHLLITSYLHLYERKLKKFSVSIPGISRLFINICELTRKDKDKIKINKYC